MFEKVQVKIIQPVIVEWKCLDCKKYNQTKVFTTIEHTPLKCFHCKKEYTGYMVLGQI